MITYDMAACGYFIFEQKKKLGINWKEPHVS